MKVAVYGGSFNPVTLGHTNVAKIVTESTDIDAVWFMPCFKSLYGKELEDDNHRLEMLKIATRCDPKFLDFDWEISNKISGRTFDIMSQLTELYHKRDLYFIIGADNVDQVITTWYRGKELIEKFKFIIVGRIGYTPVNDWYLREPHIVAHPKPESGLKTTGISSTHVRHLIKMKDYDLLNKNLDSHVLSYIIEHNLYE